MNLNEQVVLITGGAGSIGRHLVKDLCEDVRAIHVIDRDTESLERLASQIPSLATYVCDITDIKSVQATVRTAFQREHRPTVLINNAGVIHSEPLVNLMSRDEGRHSIENWHSIIDANLTSVFYMTLCFADEMVKSRSKGVVLNISSVTAVGNAGQSAYAAAKAAVNSLTVTWGKELGMLGIRCAAIAPGFIDTESTRAALSEAQIKKWKKGTPLGRLGSVEEVANAVRFVIENDYYNGQILGLDGGLRL